MQHEWCELARELGVHDRLTMPGGVTKRDVPVWMNSGDVFLNTTNIDNTPVSVLEAVACGLCVVTTNVGGVPYLVNHERNALMVAPDDVAAMTSAVRRILAEPALAETLSAGARQKAAQFDWAAIMPEWERVFRSLWRDREGGSNR